MSANSAIGQVEKYILQTIDAIGDINETTLSKGFTVNNTTTYQQVDTASRAIAAISKDTYKDTILVTNISVNEIIAEG